MITNPALVEAFERAQARQTTPGFLHNLRLVDALYQEARALGAFPLNNPLDGIEVDIRLARALNVRTAA
jgi:glycine/D-amino acid oxidase-like deaminating enzyme